MVEIQPYEIVASPYTAYTAPVGTTFPKVDVDPSTSWTTLGVSGDKNYTEDGVTVTHTQTISDFTPAGGTTPRKAWRTAEGLTVGLTLADLSAETYAQVLSASLQTQNATTALAADKHFEVMRGVAVSMYALLVKGISPFNESYSAQYEVAACWQQGNPAPKFSKQGPAELAVEFAAFELTPGVLATLRIQTAPHS